MANKKSTDRITGPVRLNFEVALTSDQIRELSEMMDAPATHTDAQKIRDMAEQLLVQMAGGGVMFTPDEVAQVEQSTGVVLSTADELIPFITDKAGMEGGMHIVKVGIDPEYYRAYSEIAEGRESTVNQIVQEITDQVIRDGWIEELRPYPRHVVMNEADSAELEAVLGGKFQTGTELIALLRAKLAPPAEEEASDLFADDVDDTVSSNVGAQDRVDL